LTGEFNNDPYADDDHLWGFNGYTSNRLDDQFFLGKDILVAPIVNPGLDYTLSIDLKFSITVNNGLICQRYTSRNRIKLIRQRLPNQLIDQ